ncbi:hypothetical protein AA103196_0716 [Ameyamaea chiangmaiensis NBRC 103196]|nr:hypothetical protein AA103196_0716 [Ameyamaea chiangmaiensis NBRC 103196]
MSELTDLRRYCGYPAVGSTASGEGSWRFFSIYGALEWRLQNLSPSEMLQSRALLDQLAPLEQAIGGASAGLDTAAAATWTRNPRELEERISLYAYTRRRLCGFLGVPAGPDLRDTREIVV